MLWNKYIELSMVLYNNMVGYLTRGKKFKRTNYNKETVHNIAK